MKFTRFAAVATLCLVGLAADDAPHVKSTMARNAIDKRYAVARRAEQEYRSKLAFADKQLVASLDQAVREAMASNDLTEATGLNTLKKQAAEHLAAEQSQNPGPAVAGTRWDWTGGGSTFFNFKADGTVTCNSWTGPGKWESVDDCTVDVIQPTKQYERITFSSDLQHSMWVEVSPAHSVYMASRAPDGP